MRPTFSDPAARLRTFALACLAVLCLALGALDARADSALDQMRVTGAVVERFDGFLEPRGGSDASALAERVNAERREIYAKRAAELGVPILEVGKIFAQKIGETAPVGTTFLRSDGSTVTK